jgi:hypothetical protein
MVKLLLEYEIAMHASGSCSWQSWPQKSINNSEQRSKQINAGHTILGRGELNRGGNVANLNYSLFFMSKNKFTEILHIIGVVDGFYYFLHTVFTNGDFYMDII